MLRIINRISGTSVLQVVRPGLTSAQTSVRSLATKEASGKGLGEAKENDPDVIEKGKKASQKQEDWQETVVRLYEMLGHLKCSLLRPDRKRKRFFVSVIVPNQS
mmetsp:Transcript_4773/g.13727  ORF Transcript_4773/g.13727 Transcript_4773/m.13727 type:complete len:104 (-) Transcript_4773:1092-1403(-)